MDLTAIVAIVAVFGSFSFLAWVVTDAIRRRRQLQVAADFHSKLLDKMQSPRELSDFLDSPGGSRFIHSISMERSHPAHRVLRATQVGVVLVAAGIGCRLVAAQQVLHRDAVEGFTVLGILLLSIGIGYLFSAGLSYGLSRSFGLFNDTSSEVR